jgi:hypothetical protein
MYRWEFAQRSETLTIDVPGVLTLDEPTMARDAAVTGAGLAYMREGWINLVLARFWRGRVSWTLKMRQVAKVEPCP